MGSLAEETASDDYEAVSSNGYEAVLPDDYLAVSQSPEQELLDEDGSVIVTAEEAVTTEGPASLLPEIVSSVEDGVSSPYASTESTLEGATLEEEILDGDLEKSVSNMDDGTGMLSKDETRYSIDSTIPESTGISTKRRSDYSQVREDLLESVNSQKRPRSGASCEFESRLHMIELMPTQLYLHRLTQTYSTSLREVSHQILANPVTLFWHTKPPSSASVLRIILTSSNHENITISPVEAVHVTSQSILCAHGHYPHCHYSGELQ